MDPSDPSLIILSDNTETSVVQYDENFQPPLPEEEYSSHNEEEEEEENALPGAICPERCTVGGPGTTGGSAQLEATFSIQSRDFRDRKLSTGGDYVQVQVIPKNTAIANGAKDVEVKVEDQKNGTYWATYTVDVKGDYEVHVAINGDTLGGSPFPVFFGPPDEAALAEARKKRLMMEVQGSAAEAKAAMDAATAGGGTAAGPGIKLPSIMGADAVKYHVKFPTDREVLERSVLVGEMNPNITLEQLSKLFSYSGVVKSCTFTGDMNRFVIMEFESAKEVESALTLDNLLLIDRNIRVEPAALVYDSRGQSSNAQAAAVQLQQLQLLQRTMNEQTSLAAQVAAMRVQAKNYPAAFAVGQPQNSSSQKAAALSAIAALSKRLERRHRRSRSRSPRRRSRSPRRRSRSPRRRSRSPRRRSRSRSPRRSRSRSSRRRSHSSRRRSDSRREKSPGSEKEKSRRKKHASVSDDDDDTHRRSKRHRSSKKDEEVDKHQEAKDREAQLLREKALQVLKSVDRNRLAGDSPIMSTDDEATDTGYGRSGERRNGSSAAAAAAAAAKADTDTDIDLPEIDP